MDQEIHEDQEINKDQQNGRKFLRRTCNEHLEGNDGSKDQWAKQDGEEGEREGGENWEDQWGASLVVPGESESGEENETQWKLMKAKETKKVKVIKARAVRINEVRRSLFLIIIHY